MKKLLQEKWFKKSIGLLGVVVLVTIIAYVSYNCYISRFFSCSRWLVIIGLSIFTMSLSYIFSDEKNNVGEVANFLEKTIIYNVPHKRYKNKIFWSRLNQTISNCFLSGRNRVENIIFMYVVTPLVIAELLMNLLQNVGDRRAYVFNQTILLGWKIFVQLRWLVVLGIIFLVLLVLLNILMKYKTLQKKNYSDSSWLYYLLLVLIILFGGASSAFIYSSIIGTITDSKDYIPLFFIVIIFMIGGLNRYYFGESRSKIEHKAIVYLISFIILFIFLAFVPQKAEIKGQYNYHYIRTEDSKGLLHSDCIVEEPEVSIFEENEKLFIFYNHGEQKNKDKNVYQLTNVKDDCGISLSVVDKKVLDENKSQAFLFDDNKKLLIYFEELHSVNIYDLQSGQTIENVIRNVLSNYSQLTMDERYNKIQFINASSKEYVDILYVSNVVKSEKN